MPRSQGQLVRALPLLIAAVLITALELLSWGYRRDSVGRVLRAHPDHSEELRFGSDEAAFLALLTFDEGRKGDNAWLAIYQLASLEADGPPVWDRSTVPIEIHRGASLPESLEVRPRSTRWGSELRSLGVAEPELGFAPAYLHPIDLDEDFWPEFFLYQHADVNRRASPVPPGAWLVRYHPDRGRWELDRWRGWKPLLIATPRVRRAQGIIFLIAVTYLLLTTPGVSLRVVVDLLTMALGALALSLMVGWDCALLVLLAGVVAGLLISWLSGEAQSQPDPPSPPPGDVST